VTALLVWNSAPRWQAAWWRASGVTALLVFEQRPTLASSVVARERVTALLVWNSAPRWQAAWWRASG
jgi:hypothetical protein